MKVRIQSADLSRQEPKLFPIEGMNLGTESQTQSIQRLLSLYINSNSQNLHFRRQTGAGLGLIHGIWLTWPEEQSDVKACSLSRVLPMPFCSHRGFLLHHFVCVHECQSAQVQESVLSFHHVSSGDYTGVLRLGNRHVYLLSHLSSPPFFFSFKISFY